MFAGINMFWARLGLILARAVRQGLMSAETGPTYVYFQEYKLHYFYGHLGGHCENKNGKNNSKTV